MGNLAQRNMLTHMLCQCTANLLVSLLTRDRISWKFFSLGLLHGGDQCSLVMVDFTFSVDRYVPYGV